MDRRTTIKWMLAAAASSPLLNSRAFGQEITAQPVATGYGSDPDLTKIYRPGDVWPLTPSAGYDPAGYRTAFGILLALQLAAMAWFFLMRLGLVSPGTTA